jgi:ESCRT-II complex subunit VPS36
MFLHQIDLTTALRPSLLADETLLFVQDGVGLYEGLVSFLIFASPKSKILVRKFKIPQCQHGQVYLTSHRACYVDNDDPRKNSVAVDLKDIDHSDFYVGLHLVSFSG